MNNILLEHTDHVAVVTVNRPSQLNALNSETIAELSKVLDELAGNDDVRAIVLTGSGEKAFVAGADIKEFADFSQEEGRRLSAEGHKMLFNKLEKMPKPVIAAINGYALGGGLELAMSAHIRLASDNAMLGLPEVSLGVIPGYGGTQRLTRLVGMGKALEMICTAGMTSAADAKSWGLVNNVTTQEELMPAAMKMAGKMAKQSPSAITQALIAVRAGMAHDQDGFTAEINAFGECFGTEDFKEGTTAFLNKRKPSFTGK
ncbi:MAG: enoyl-CoA hydratase-related protein [Flavobacteriales bacterium]|nr:enoyl-CoA hydratase-related protein [Flavobacteriales bacterium]MDG1780750.1 enoyl-CoA hydratase-related protein [Flavobacteriales bacterium]MDG2245438.1 enoyl-CoA hydratase-related protein [Flavobacteriales bacterium]